MKYNKRTLFIQGNLDYYINLFFFPRCIFRRVYINIQNWETEKANNQKPNEETFSSLFHVNSPG